MPSYLNPECFSFVQQVSDNAEGWETNSTSSRRDREYLGHRSLLPDVELDPKVELVGQVPCRRSIDVPGIGFIRCQRNDSHISCLSRASNQIVSNGSVPCRVFGPNACIKLTQ